MKNIIKLGLITSILTLSITAATANGLKLCGKNNDKIIVKCGHDTNSVTQTPFPIPHNSCILGGAYLPWSSIQGFLRGTSGVCQFFDGENIVGTANIKISGSQGNITAVETASNFITDPNNFPTGPKNEISVTMTQLN